MAFVGSALDVILLADFSFGDSVSSSLPMEPLLLRLRVLPKLSLDLVRGRPGDCCVAMLDALGGFIWIVLKAKDVSDDLKLVTVD